MNSKVTPVLEKTLQDKAKGHYQKALRRITEALEKHPDEVELYLEGADVCMEGGEPLQATHFLKKAYSRFNAETDRIDTFAREKLRNLGDPVLGKFLLEQAIKRRHLEWCSEILEELQDRAVRELLQRTRTKKQTLNSAARGGYALKSEMVVNVLSEALLCLRLGRMKAAVQSFLEILDDKPVENEVLEPFFSSLEKKYPKAGRIRFAYACSLIYAQQYDKAMSHLVQGVKIEPKVAEEALERLRVLTEQFETPPNSVQDALVEVLMAKGDVLRAAELLQESLASNPEHSKRVMELMKPYVEDVSDSLVLHYLYMDAALAADQTRRVLEKLKMIKRSEPRRKDLYQWLEKKSSEKFLPAEIMILHGEMALELNHNSRAVEIFDAVLASSPGDAQAALAILEKHKGSDRELARLYKEQSEKLRCEAPQQSDDAFEFEHFENNEFKFSGGSQEELQIDTETAQPTPETSEPPEQRVEPVELDAGPYAKESDDNEEEQADEGHGEGAQKSPLELGLEQAAKAAVKGESTDILWEEEDADGVVERGDDQWNDDAQDDDSWLETQGATVMGGHDTASATSAEPDDVHLTEEPEDVAPQEEPEDVSPPEEPEDVTPPEEPEDVSPPEEPEDVTPPEEPEDVSPPEEPEDVAPQEEPVPADVPPSDEAAREIDLNQVLELAASLRAAGARLFFHVQEESSGEPTQQPHEQPQADEDEAESPSEEVSSDEDATSESVSSETDTVPPEEDVRSSEDEADVQVYVPDSVPMASSPDPPDPFVSQFDRYLDGQLENDAIIILTAEALERGKNDEARELLHFAPRNENEELARMRHLADYYLAVEQPSTALDIIESLKADSLPDDDRRELMIKQASCHSKLNDFDSVKAVYKKIADEFPSDEIETMAKRNDERINIRRSGDALVLEKTTSLQDD